jgi:hypothetical protein
MSDGVVVLEMILESPLIVEGAQAQVAAYIVSPGILQMVLEAIAIFEHALAQIAVVLVISR